MSDALEQIAKLNAKLVSSETLIHTLQTLEDETYILMDQFRVGSVAHFQVSYAYQNFRSARRMLESCHQHLERTLQVMS